MILKVFSKPETEEKVIFLKLYGYTNRIYLEAVNFRGEFLAGIITICEDGTMIRNRSVGNDLGFQLDNKGRIVEKDY